MSGAETARTLLWIGSAIALSVLVTVWFFSQTVGYNEFVLYKANEKEWRIEMKSELVRIRSDIAELKHHIDARISVPVPPSSRALPEEFQ